MAKKPAQAPRMPRHPLDGEPYYCAACGAAFYQYLQCRNFLHCRLETFDAAILRKVDDDKQRKVANG